MKYTLTFLFGLLAIGALTNFTSEPSPLKKLEGKWRVEGNLDNRFRWYLEYTFTENTYELEGYPSLHESGIIQLKEVKGDSLLFHLHAATPNPAYQERDQWIYLKDSTLSLNNHTFLKQSEEQ